MKTTLNTFVIRSGCDQAGRRQLTISLGADQHTGAHNGRHPGACFRLSLESRAIGESAFQPIIRFGLVPKQVAAPHRLTSQGMARRQNKTR